MPVYVCERERERGGGGGGRGGESGEARERERGGGGVIYKGLLFLFSWSIKRLKTFFFLTRTVVVNFDIRRTWTCGRQSHI